MIGHQSEMRPVAELAAHLLRRGSPLRIRARGDSMTPFLWDGDVALVSPTEKKEVGLGEVICYEAPGGRLFLHRVIARDGDRLVTKGDALAFTEVVDRAQVLGKVVAVERRGKITRLDTRRARWRNRAIASLSPFLPRLLAVARRLRRARRGWRPWLT